MPPEMPALAVSADHHTVAFEGFSEFERAALATFFRLAAKRSPAYEQAQHVDACDFLIADADNAAALEAVQASGRLRETVFIGTHAPAGAMAWLMRPIDPMHIVRELDSLVEQRSAGSAIFCEPLALPSVDLFLQDIDLPFYQAATASAPTRPATMERRRNRGGGGRDVLVVDDSAIARKFLQLRLQRLRYRAHLAPTGERAMEMLAQQAFSLVFLDITLGPPGSLDGLQLCQHIKQRPSHPGGLAPKVAMVTGLAGPMDRVRGALAGCDAYLGKPLAESEFIASLFRLDPGFAWAADTAARQRAGAIHLTK
jgi:two-component system, cell cycle response regulator